MFMHPVAAMALEAQRETIKPEVIEAVQRLSLIEMAIRHHKEAKAALEKLTHVR